MAKHRRRHDQTISKGVPTFDNLHFDITIFNEPGWQKVEDLPEEVVKCMKRGYDKATSRYASELLTQVKRAIIRGRPPTGYWEPMSEKYKKVWNKKYPEHHLMYLTGQYLRSVGHFTRGKRSYIGVVRGEKRAGPQDNPSLTMNQVAIILEFGSADGKIPARPLWSMAVEKIESGRFPLKTQILQEIRHQLILRDLI